jgi:hypothetical protein
MNPTLKSVVLGYQFDHPANGTNPYINLTPDQKEQADGIILRILNLRFPFALRRRWLLGTTSRIHATADTVREETNRMLGEVDAANPVSIDTSSNPFCSYVIIRGGHRLSYSFALNETTSGGVRQLSFNGGNYDRDTGTTTTPTETVTVVARGYVTASWEHPIPLTYFNTDQLLQRLIEQDDEEEGRVPALLAKLFHQ